VKRAAVSVLAVLLGACGGGNSAGPAIPLVWEKDYAGALQKAKAEGKLVLIDFHADW
jgi:hypothetical protein